MLNKLINTYLNKVSAKMMQDYKGYVQTDTAVVVIGPQREFFDESSRGYKLTQKTKQASKHRDNMVHLVHEAREKGYLIIAVPYEAVTQSDGDRNEYSTPIHKLYHDNQFFLEDRHVLEASFNWSDLDITTGPLKKLDALTGSDLNEILIQKNIEKVILSGLLTNISVDSTARMLAEYDYHTTLISDACLALEDKEHDYSVDVSLPRYVQSIMKTEEIIKQL